MQGTLSAVDQQSIRNKIQEKYARVAASPAGSFQYPTGREGLVQQGYPLELMQDFPAALLDSFCGVGNPFSLGPLHAGEAVLDLGCGAGLDAFLAGRLVGPTGQVTGLDLTPEMIARARAFGRQLGVEKVRFQVGEVENLPFPDCAFDVILSNGVLNLTLDKERALREAHRVLKPKGRLMLADMVLVSPLPEDQAGRIDNWYQ